MNYLEEAERIADKNGIRISQDLTPSGKLRNYKIYRKIAGRSDVFLTSKVNSREVYRTVCQLTKTDPAKQIPDEVADSGHSRF